MEVKNYFTRKKQVVEIVESWAATLSVAPPPSANNAELLAITPFLPFLPLPPLSKLLLSHPPPSPSFSTLCCFFGEMTVALANDDISRRHRTISDDDNQQFPTNSDCNVTYSTRKKYLFRGKELVVGQPICFPLYTLRHVAAHPCQGKKRYTHAVYTKCILQQIPRKKGTDMGVWELKPLFFVGNVVFFVPFSPPLP